MKLVIVHTLLCLLFTFVSGQQVTLTSSNLPIIVITTEDGVEDRERALALGAVNYVTKPLDRDSIIEMTNSMLLSEV